MRGPRVPAAFFDWLTVRRCVWIMAIAIGVVIAAGTHGPGALAQAATIAGFIAAAPIIALVGHYFGWVDERVWAPWQGIYHAFDDHQIRVVEARGRLWYASDDVHEVLGMSKRDAALRAMGATECRRDAKLGVVLSSDGIARLIGPSTDRRALRLLNWARHEVERPWAKKRERNLAVAGSSAASSTSASPVAAPPAPDASSSVRPMSSDVAL
jgi:hypothetical protein